MIRRTNDLVVYLVVAFGLSWLIAAPAWFTGGLRSPVFVVVAACMMATPSIAVLVVWRLKNREVRFRDWARRTGLTLGPRKGRTLWLVLAAWVGTPVVVGVAIAISAALGLVSLDLAHLSLYAKELARTGRQLPPVQTVFSIQLAFAVVLAPLLNAIPALGEEWGWRGWLLPRLTTYGTFRGLLLSGVIWGLWHFPVTLLGYNYPDFGGWAAPYFIIACVCLGFVIGWLRLRSGSVWPSVIAHGSFNATAGLIILAGDAAHPPRPEVAGVTGPVGWILLALLAVVLFWRWPATNSDCPAAPVGADSARADQTRDAG
ncbi:CPBP family intramembrane glutamic endopeptidase [Fodinicola acaciae]|uniref:CPBP family intramembrane glutamic endopeptidase n=1 Tax=Fodinicola acaciae TaxID=2681555 RepID=UPI0013D5836A|nr:CPBP family intramembrane glutamic endopeptidase [Fodinicola acaciae]